MIRQLKSFEVPICVPFGQAAYIEGQLPGTFKPDIFVESWRKLIDAGSGIIFAAFKGSVGMGGLGVVIYSDLMNGDLTAGMSFWYVFEQFRMHSIRLLVAFESWAKESKIVRIAMNHLCSHPELAKLYERRGYRFIEAFYIKEVA
jgi:hypothetical protein